MWAAGTAAEAGKEPRIPPTSTMLVTSTVTAFSRRTLESHSHVPGGAVVCGGVARPGLSGTTTGAAVVDQRCVTCGVHPAPNPRNDCNRRGARCRLSENFARRASGSAAALRQGVLVARVLGEGLLRLGDPAARHGVEVLVVGHQRLAELAVAAAGLDQLRALVAALVAARQG